MIKKFLATVLVSGWALSVLWIFMEMQKIYKFIEGI
jgi:hypothetical protein